MSHNNGFDEWGGYMEAKITKLEEQFSAASDPFRQSDLFKGISIYVNGLTDPSADELKRIMMVHGGTYHHYERSHTRYIIASNLPDVKVRNMNTSKIISPQWVVDCLRERRILDYTRYLLYSNQKTSQPRIAFIKEYKKEETTTANTEDVANIMKGLDELNAKIRESLATPGSIIAELAQEPPTAAAQKHNAAASGSGGNVARTAVDPKFLSEFYNNSRLHHIATLGAGFKQYVSELREQHGEVGFPARALLKEKLQAQAETQSSDVADLAANVMHIDMDCFFVSVGLRKHPELRGRPVAVTHSKGGAAAREVPVHPGADRELESELFAKRFEQHMHNNVLTDKVRHGFDAKMSLSEIASCSYEARAKGLRNGMFVGQAVKLCPELQTIPYDFEGYKEVANTLYNTIAQYTLQIEAVSCDELFVDLADVLAELQVAPMQFVSAIREEVRQKTGCPCSAGVGANKLQARMATKRAKPDGQFHLVATDVEAYFADIPIRELPGVGSSTAYTLKEVNLLSCGDLQQVSLARLQMLVGKKFGETLQQFCRGIDTRPLAYEQVRKSVSAEVNYGIRFKEYAELETFLRQLCGEVHTRLSDIKRKTKCITLKLMVRAKEAPVETSKFMGHGVCDHITKSVSLPEFTNELELITRHILATMKVLKLPPHELRGIGIQLSKLDEPHEAHQKKQQHSVLRHMFERVAEKQKDRKAEVTTADTPAEIAAVSAAAVVLADESAATSLASKSATKKTRGRPPKEEKVETKKRPNVMSMLQNAAAKRVASDKSYELSRQAATSTLPEHIDPEVFAALPEDIRAEILQEKAHQEAARTLMTIKATTTTTTSTKPISSSTSSLNESDMLPSTSRAAQERRQRQELASVTAATPAPVGLQVDAEFLAALPADLRAEIEADIAAEQQRLRTATPPLAAEANAADAAAVPMQQQIDVNNVFAQKNCIEQLLDWVKGCPEPSTDDVVLLCDYARELVRAKDIGRLYEPLVYLCRLLNSLKDSEDDCAWHAAYKQLLAAVQSEMREVYDGRKLYLNEQLSCDKCAAT